MNQKLEEDLEAAEETSKMRNISLLVDDHQEFSDRYHVVKYIGTRRTFQIKIISVHWVCRRPDVDSVPRVYPGHIDHCS